MKLHVVYHYLLIPDFPYFSFWEDEKQLINIFNIKIYEGFLNKDLIWYKIRVRNPI